MLLYEILVLVLLTLMNGLLAMSELAVVSSRRSRLEHLASQGGHGARTALRLMDDPGRFLSTIQIGITLAGVIAGAFSGATIGQRLGSWLNTLSLVSPHGKALGISITVLGTTYMSLILGELVPKRVALAQPERIAALAARPMRVLSLVAAPVVWALHVSTVLVLRVLGLSGVRETTVTEDEVKSLIVEGTLAGVFVPQERQMIDGVLRLADRTVRVIMTPRSRIVWIDAESDRRTILDMVQSHRFSRLLVCKATVDHPIGVVHIKDLLPLALCCADVDLAELMKQLLYIPEGTTVLHLLSRFKKEGVHIAVVVDEYGSTQGLVTLTDLIEAIAGELPEEGEDKEHRIVRRDDGSWLVDGLVPTDEVQTITGVSMGQDVVTVAGFVLDHLGRIPETGASFVHGNARFEVVDMDGNRIDKVLIMIDRSLSESFGRKPGP